MAAARLRYASYPVDPWHDARAERAVPHVDAAVRVPPSHGPWRPAAGLCPTAPAAARPRRLERPPRVPPPWRLAVSRGRASCLLPHVRATAAPVREPRSAADVPDRCVANRRERARRRRPATAGETPDRSPTVAAAGAKVSVQAKAAEVPRSHPTRRTTRGLLPCPDRVAV